MRYKYKPTIIESARLSDGSLLEISRIGRKYYVMHASPILGEPPETWFDLSRADAYEIFTQILGSDVLEAY